MGQAKIKRSGGFAAHLIEEWETDDCVNFAVALARMTGWLLHVDWWSTSTTALDDDHIQVDQLKPLRVYVADNRDKIFDVRGVKTIFEFTQGTSVKIAKNVATGNGGVLTRYYDEARLLSLPLRSQPDEAKITHAMDAIKANPIYLAFLPERPRSGISAYDAARYTFGRCAAFAEAMHELTGLQPVALLATRFAPLFNGTRRAENGYFHSVVMHPDGMAEDAWGKASINEIASRFGAIEVHTSIEEQRRVVENIRRVSVDIHEYEFKKALDIILAHRGSQAS